MSYNFTYHPKACQCSFKKKWILSFILTGEVDIWAFKFSPMSCEWLSCTILCLSSVDEKRPTGTSKQLQRLLVLVFATRLLVYLLLIFELRSFFLIGSHFSLAKKVCGCWAQAKTLCDHSRSDFAVLFSLLFPLMWLDLTAIALLKVLRLRTWL